MRNKPNSEKCALTGVAGAELVRDGRMQPIGEIYKSELDGHWHAWAGYDIPAEFRGSWKLRTEAVFAINEAHRLYIGELSGALVGAI